VLTVVDLASVLGKNVRAQNEVERTGRHQPCKGMIEVDGVS
jgi:hypothetical protein